MAQWNRDSLNSCDCAIQGGRLAEDRRADPDDRGAFLDGDLEIVAHAHRQLGAASARRRRRATRSSRSGRSAAKYGPGRFRVVDRGRQQHQPGHPDGAAGGRPSKIGIDRLGRRAVLGRLAGEIDLDQHVDRASGARRRPRRASASSDGAVHRVDDVERGGGLARLVRLQMADEMPAERQIGEVARSSAGLPAPCSRRSRRWPASAAARTWSAENVLETAMRRTEAGSRPARPAARAMRSRTPSSRARSAAESNTLLLQRVDELLGHRGVRSGRRELADTSRTRRPPSAGSRRRASCRACSAPRRGSGLAATACSKSGLASATLAAVEEDDALVVERVGVAGAPPAAR